MHRRVRVRGLMRARKSYPMEPIRIIVPFPRLGSADLLTRTIRQKLA